MGAIRNLDIKKLKETHNCQLFIETGSGYGTGIFYASQFNFGHILSVEIDSEQTELLNKFFRYDSRIKIFNGLSKDFLQQILPQVNPNIPCLLFLDAHFPGADLKKSNFDDEKNEDIRMPLYDELQIVKQNRVDKGAKDVIIIDDVMLYDDENEYEAGHQKKTMNILPLKHRNYLNKFIDLFKETHNYTLLKSEQGWLIFTPK